VVTVEDLEVQAIEELVVVTTHGLVEQVLLTLVVVVQVLMAMVAQELVPLVVMVDHLPLLDHLELWDHITSVEVVVVEVQLLKVILHHNIYQELVVSQKTLDNLVM
jgi:hypothetical protein